MKTTRQLLLACCLTGAAAGFAHAQPPAAEHLAGPGQAGPRHDPAKMLDHMRASLQLSEAQTQQVKAIFEASAKQRKTLAEKYKIAEREVFAAEIKKLRAETKQKINAVLTEPQRQARDAQLQHAHWRKAGKHRGDCGPQRHRHMHMERRAGSVAD